MNDSPKPNDERSHATFDLTKAVNKSGFPLQIAITNLVNSRAQRSAWSVRHTEHSWRHAEAQREGYIDLVVVHRNAGITFVVECKRAHNTSWIFLNPQRNLQRRHAKAWVTMRGQEKVQWFGWENVAADPSSPEAEFCIVKCEGGKPNQTLEDICRPLVLSVEALAQEEVITGEIGHDSLQLYFNVIVTTAELQVGTFDPSTISLRDGTLPAAEFHSHPFVRLRKQFSTTPVNQGQPVLYEPHDVAAAKENTVFIVQADHFAEFLDQFEVDNDLLRRFRISSRG